MALQRGLVQKGQLRALAACANFKVSPTQDSKRHRSDDLSYNPQLKGEAERARSVTSFYNQSAIDSAANKVSSASVP